jgi:hypothetical protein
MAAGRTFQIKHGNTANLGTVKVAIAELGLNTETGELISSQSGSANIVVGGLGVLRDTAAGITLANDFTLKGNPTADNMAANKAYVDAARMGLDVKGSVRAATVVDGTLATAFANGQTIDTVELATGDRILIKNQTSGGAGIDNGIYIVQASGPPVRATDMPAGVISASAYMFIDEGSQAHTGWIMTNTGTITVGSSTLVFAQYNAGGVYSASLGVEKVGSDMRLDILANAGLALTGNEIGIKVDAGFPKLSIGADGLKLAVASAQYKFLVSTSTPFNYVEGSISDLAGTEATTGLVCTAGVLAIGNVDCGAFA